MVETAILPNPNINLKNTLLFFGGLFLLTVPLTSWRGEYNFPDAVRGEAIRDSYDRGLITPEDNAEVHHMIPARVGYDQGIDPELIKSEDNALAIPDWVHKELHKKYTNEELASMGLDGTLEAIEEIKENAE